MPRSTGNPVLAPIRRWILYSRTNLAVTVAVTFATLIALGLLFNQSPSATTQSTDDPATSPTSEPVQPISYELVEVSEATVSGRSSQWVTSSAPAAAMAYAHTYIDQSLTDTSWTSTLARYTLTAPGDSFAAARPPSAVAITGPTTSRLVAGEGTARLAQVSIPTQAGPLQITVKVTASPSGPKWLVDNPLPTLDLSQIVPHDAHPTVPRSGSGASSTTSGASNTAPTAPAPSSAPPSTGPLPLPQTGPIPVPDLDTPLPGSR
ncbi:hypothetical protein [Nocardia nova]|uniref:hypothetical protein n=1 Tax=Nocardia nova TaxID=37330 RepID=UPI0033DB2AF1